jgi:hypothetical protein
MSGEHWRELAARLPAPDAYLAARAEYDDNPAERLRAFLDRAAPAVDKYRHRGKVAQLAIKAARAVDDLKASPGFRFEGHSAGIPPSEPAARDFEAAEFVCNALAAELARLQALAEAGRTGGRRKAEAHHAEGLGHLRDVWERVRQSADSDTAADKMASRVEAWASHGWEAVKARRQRAEKKSGRWRRP